MRISIVVLAVALLAGPAASAWADDKAAAEAEFVRARKLMKEGKVSLACAAFAKSQALDPQMGTNYNLALCYEQDGKLASAWLVFRELAQLDTNKKRKKDSDQRAQALEPRLTKVLLTSDGPTPGLVVTRDGEDVTNLIGIEVPIDPGKYRYVASAPGYLEHAIEVDVGGDGAVVTVSIPALSKPEAIGDGVGDVGGDGDGDGGGVGDGDGGGDGVGDGGGDGGGDGDGGMSGRTIAGIGIAGAGVIAIGVGLGFGAKARTSWAEVTDLCGEDLSCDNEDDFARAQGLVDDTRSAGNLSTALVGVGAAAVVGGVILWLTAPSGERADAQALRIVPRVDHTGVGVVAAGSF